MGLLDKFKEIITENDDDFDDYYDDDNRDYGLAAPERAERQERPRHERAPKPERQERPRSRGRDDKVVNIHTTTQLQVVLVKPERFEEAASIGDNLNWRAPTEILHADCWISSAAWRMPTTARSSG